MSPELESLLRDEGWVRQLARRLVREADADDLVQEAWLAARRAPAERGGDHGRRWLAAVLRNRVRQERRSGARRAERERAAARSEALPAADELLERLELREQVVRAVRELREPYRSALLMRWFEGLSPREIARRRNVPRRTVHAWLARGLELLRARLRGELGAERGGWLAALAPLCDGPSPPFVPAAWSPWLGAAVMTANLKLALAPLAVLGVLAAYLAVRDVPGAREGAQLEAEPPPEVALARPELESPGELPARGLAAAGDPVEEASPAPAAAPAPAPKLLVRGRAIDLGDLPIEGLALSLAGLGSAPDVHAVTASDGIFEFEPAAKGGDVRIDDPRWTMVFQPHVSQGEASDFPVLVAAPRIALAGVVLDSEQRPIPDAELRVSWDANVRSRFSRVLDRSLLVEAEARTDAAGHFELDSVPSTSLATLEVEHVGHATRWLEIPQASDWNLAIVLESDTDRVRVLAGRVVDLEGNPVADAWIGLDGVTARSGPEGQFALPIDEPGERGVLMAASSGREPAFLERAAASNLDPAAWPEPLELVIGGPALSIRGRVLDAAGEPVAGAAVELLDKTPFGAIPLNDSSDLLVGAELESLLAGLGCCGYGGAEADAHGHFVLGSLTQREYKLRVHDSQSLTFVELAAAPGPREIEIRMPDPGPLQRFAGRVVFPDGSPASGAHVRLMVQAEGQPLRLGAQVTADADGRFATEGAKKVVTHFWIEEAEPLPGNSRFVELAGRDPLRLELVLPRSCHVQVELADPAEATSFELRDAEGNVLNATFYNGNLAWGQPRIDLVEGRSQALLASELATELALYRGDELLRRVPIALAPGELTTVRP